MKKKKSWKHILEYELGVLILVAVLLVAWFGPDLYASWQDQSQNGKVVCSSRDEIRFLDTDSLDIAGRMVLLRDATYRNWYENDVYYDGSRMTQEEIEQLLIQRPRSLAEQWVEAGVMPEQFVRQIPRTLQEADVLEEGTSSGIYSVVVDQNVLNVLVLNYVKSADVYGSPSIVGLVLDADKDILYYAAFYDPDCWDWMAKRLGGDANAQDADGSAYADLLYRYKDKKELPEHIVDCGDLAAVSSAESADVANEKGLPGDTYGLYQDFTLQYERFTSTARVALTGFTGKGYGWSVALGTPLWNHFYNEIMDYSEGTPCYNGTAEDWFIDPYATGGGSANELPYNEEAYDDGD